MIATWQRLVKWFEPPLRQGTLILVVLISVFLHQSLFSSDLLIAADTIYEIDPLWQPLAPAEFAVARNGVVSDHFMLFYPWQAYTRQALVRGQFAFWHPPLWNGAVNSGHPFMGNLQSALYDPLHLLTFLIPFPQSIDFLAWLRLFVAGFFMLWLALEFGLSRRAAYLAMIVFTFAMPQIVWLGFTKASVLAWLPALWLFSARLIRHNDWHKGRRDMVALALVTTAQLMGGHPEGSIYLEIAWGTFVLWGLWFLWRRGQSFWPAARQFMLGGLLGLSLAAVQWLPLLEVIQHSTALAQRSETVISLRTLLFNWQQWVGGISLVMGNFFGNPRLDNHWFPYLNFNEQNFFMGVTPLALALLVIFSGRASIRPTAPVDQTPAAPHDFWRTPTLWSGPAGYFAGVAIIGVGMALSLPGFALLAQLPGLRLVRPTRWRGIVLGAVALLSGYGLDLYLRALMAQSLGGRTTQRDQDAAGTPRTPILRRWVWIWGILGVGSALGALTAHTLIITYRSRIDAAIIAGAATITASPFFRHTTPEQMAAAEMQRIDQLVARLHPTYWPSYLPLWLGLLLVIVPWLLIRRSVAAPRRGQIMGSLILVLVVAELWRLSYDYNPTMAQQEVLPTPPQIEALYAYEAANPQEDAGPFRVIGTHATLLPNVNMVFGLEDVRGYEPSAAYRYNEFMQQVDGAIPFSVYLLFDHLRSPMLDFLNARYAFVDNSEGAAEDDPVNAPIGEQWQPIAQRGKVTLYTNPAALPRAFLVYTAHPVRTRAESLARLADPTFDSRREVILEVANDAETQALTALQTPATPGQSMITHYTPGKLTVDVDTPVEALLVLSESYLPGWHATIDGMEAPLYIANHAFHAVRVPAGGHTVAFYYLPMSYVLGKWISLGALGLILGLLLWPRRRNAVT